MSMMAGSLYDLHCSKCNNSGNCHPVCQVSVFTKTYRPAVCCTMLFAQVWRDCLETKAASPYLTHMLPLGGIQSLRFCPYEDVLGVGCAGGISSLLVPGAGEPNFDSFVANPYQGKKERQEQEVVQLLDKLQPETIMLDPSSIGKVSRAQWGCRVHAWRMHGRPARHGSRPAESAREQRVMFLYVPTAACVEMFVIHNGVLL